MHKILVIVDDNCNYGYSENPAISDPAKKETFRWMCPTHDLTIQFLNGNPFNKKASWSTSAVAGAWTPPATVDNTCPPRTYKYTATVEGCPPDDPTVIIDGGRSLSFRRLKDGTEFIELAAETEQGSISLQVKIARGKKRS